jgi:HlyD family secretion protein
MKILIVIVLVVAALGGGWFYWSKSHTEKVEYQTADVTRGDVVQSVSATGQLNPVTNVTVSSQISGNISKVNADFNSIVTAGEVVAQIDPAPYEASVDQAKANVAYAKAALELANLTADRKKELVAEHAAPQADLDTAIATQHQALATVQIQQANLETAQINLDHCTISTPISGIVISSSVAVGETVAASFNAPVLFTIANDLAKMQIDASVAEGDIGQLAVGQEVNFNVDAYPTRTFHGKVAQIRNSPSTVQNVVTYDTVVAVNNDDQKLKPGMTANLFIVIAQQKDAVRIPNSALRFRPPDEDQNKGSPSPGAPGGQGSPKPHPQHPNGTKTIYTMPPGGTTPQPVQVKLGITDGIYTEVTEGLKEGDSIVTGMITPGATGGQGGGGGGGFGMRRPF